jgi:hypothetical protein
VLQPLLLCTRRGQRWHQMRRVQLAGWLAGRCTTTLQGCSGQICTERVHWWEQSHHAHPARQHACWTRTGQSCWAPCAPPDPRPHPPLPPQLQEAPSAYRWWEEAELRELAAAVGLQGFARQRSNRFILFVVSKPAGGGHGTASAAWCWRDTWWCLHPCWPVTHA